MLGGQYLLWIKICVDVSIWCGVKMLEVNICWSTIFVGGQNFGEIYYVINTFFGQIVGKMLRIIIVAQISLSIFVDGQNVEDDVYVGHIVGKMLGIIFFAWNIGHNICFCQYLLVVKKVEDNIFCLWNYWWTVKINICGLKYCCQYLLMGKKLWIF